MFYSKYLINNPEMCIGDHEHNDLIKLLFNGTTIKNKEVKIFCDNFMKARYSTGNWIFQDFTKQEIKKLNAFFKSKTLKTKIKRFMGIIDLYSRGSYITQMFLYRSRLKFLTCYEYLTQK